MACPGVTSGITRGSERRARDSFTQQPLLAFHWPELIIRPQLTQPLGRRTGRWEARFACEPQGSRLSSRVRSEVLWPRGEVVTITAGSFLIQALQPQHQVRLSSSARVSRFWEDFSDLGDSLGPERSLITVLISY